VLLRLWFLHRLSRDPTQFNCLSIYNARGTLQVSRLRRAIATVVARHDSLRSCFYSKSTNGDAVQAVLKNPADCFKHVQAKDESQVKIEIDLLKHHVWRLADGESVRVVLVSHSADDHCLLIGYHHLVMDGIGHYIFLQDVTAAYMGKPLRRMNAGFLDLAVKERETLQQGSMDDHIAYWVTELSPPPEVIDLLTFALVKRRPATDAFVNNEALQELGPSLTSQLVSASRNLRVTPFYFHMAALQVLFYRLLGAGPICIGTTDANRTEASSDVVVRVAHLQTQRIMLRKKPNSRTSSREPARSIGQPKLMQVCHLTFCSKGLTLSVTHLTRRCFKSP
jgi:hypothetical protein